MMNQNGLPTSHNATEARSAFALRAIDAKGGVVCDTVDAPVIPNFGGLGSERALAEGEPFLEPAVLNPMCPGLGRIHCIGESGSNRHGMVGFPVRRNVTSVAE